MVSTCIAVLLIASASGCKKTPFENKYAIAESKNPGWLSIENKATVMSTARANPINIVTSYSILAPLSIQGRYRCWSEPSSRLGSSTLLRSQGNKAERRHNLLRCETYWTGSLRCQVDLRVSIGTRRPGEVSHNRTSIYLERNSGPYAKRVRRSQICGNHVYYRIRNGMSITRMTRCPSSRKERAKAPTPTPPAASAE